MYRVLMIDDLRPQSFAEIQIQKWLGNQPFTLDIARSYKSGISHLTRTRYDLLLLDHDLGSFDRSGQEWTGYDILQWLHANQRRLPGDIKIITANPVAWPKMQQFIKDYLYPQRG